MDGDVNGHIVAGSDFTGNLTVAAVYNGGLCADNLSPSQPLPLNIQIGCGIGTTGTICGQEPVCLGGDIASAAPPHGTHDARQPHPINDNSLSARQGIGSPNPDAGPQDKITLTLNSSGLRAISHDCWSLCETGVEQVEPGTPSLSPNKVTCVRELVSGGDQYRIELERPISGGHWTTISYLGGASYVSYASMPGDVNYDGIDDFGDLSALHYYLGLNPLPACSAYCCDIDHDGVCEGNPTYEDLYVAWDVMTGVDKYINWMGEWLRPNTCPGGGGESASMLAGSAESTIPDAATLNAWLADEFVRYLTTAGVSSDDAADRLVGFVDWLTGRMVEHLGADERAALADRLAAPKLTFASREAAGLVPDIVSRLRD